jgi:tetratricopeptide (TPR) repeat protein
MTRLRQLARQIGAVEAAALIVFGIALALVFVGQLDAVALIILLIWGFIVYSTYGMVQQAQRFRPVEPPNTWRVTLIANIALTTIGLSAFGWYMLGGGALAWVPFLVFIAGVMALRQWRQGVVSRVYAWRTPALTLLQKGEYKQLTRALEADEGLHKNPDKLAVLALAYIDLNKWQKADKLLIQARALAPEFASVNGALGSLRRHQARYDEAVNLIRKALAFEDSVSSRYYLALCQYLGGNHDGAVTTLRAIIDDPTLMRQGQVVGAYILGQSAEHSGDEAGARAWYARMAEYAPQVIPVLEQESRRHKQTEYGDALKGHIRAMQKIIAQRPVTGGVAATDTSTGR